MPDRLRRAWLVWRLRVYIRQTGRRLPESFYRFAREVADADARERAGQCGAVDATLTRWERMTGGRS